MSGQEVTLRYGRWQALAPSDSADRPQLSGEGSEQGGGDSFGFLVVRKMQPIKLSASSMRALLEACGFARPLFCLWGTKS